MAPIVISGLLTSTLPRILMTICEVLGIDYELKLLENDVQKEGVRENFQNTCL
jgi:hypothetical protein